MEQVEMKGYARREPARAFRKDEERGVCAGGALRPRREGKH